MTRLPVGRLLARPGAAPAQRDVAIVVEDGRIQGVEAAPQTAASARLLAMPAVANAHDHGHGLRPLSFGAKDDALECWIQGLRARPPTDLWLEAAVAFGRMAVAGIGTTVHCHNLLHADRLVEEAGTVARAARDVGIRAAFCCPILDRNAWVYGGPEALRPEHTDDDWSAVLAWLPRAAPAADQLARVDAIAEAHGRPDFDVQYGPIGPQWCQDRTLELIALASARTGRRVHMHLLESRRQREWLDSQYQGGIVAHLDRIGLLSPRLTVAHGVWLTEAECALLAERGVTVVVNTASNLRLRSGIAPVARFLEAGLPFALGLDGTALDDDQDALRDLRLAHLLHAGTGLRPALSTARLFEAALGQGVTVAGGDGDQGKLEPGCNADVLCLDYAAMAKDVLAESVDEITVLMARMSARHVASLHVAGREIVAGGRLTAFDLEAAEAELLAQARRGEDRLRQEAPLLDRHRDAVRRYYEKGRHLGA